MNLRQGRSSAIMVNIEPTIYAILKDLVDHESTSASSYCRRLILDDLSKKGLVPDSLLAELFKQAS